MPDLKQLRLPSEAEMREAIAQRNPQYDQTFLYGVITTGVFCLPSCAARPARPENIRFFFDSHDAEQAGLRSCKRCRPLEAAAEKEQLVELARYISQHADQKLTLSELAKRLELSPTTLQKRFSSLFGVSPRAFQDHERNKRLKASLRAQRSITDSIHAAGFGSTSRVYDSTSTMQAMTPAAYRAGGAGEEISYATSNTALGWVLMAATHQGVCFAQFGASAKALKKLLSEEFPQATLKPSPEKSSAQINAWLRALEAHLCAKAPRPDLPLDLRGTAFQIQVWKFLLQIPSGQTASYGEVASGIQRKSAVRAAASACGANRIAVLIPCHRVLRGDGSLGGYRWGTERKQQLLDKEASPNPL